MIDTKIDDFNTQWIHTNCAKINCVCVQEVLLPIRSGHHHTLTCQLHRDGEQFGEFDSDFTNHVTRYSTVHVSANECSDCIVLCIQLD